MYNKQTSKDKARSGSDARNYALKALIEIFEQDAHANLVVNKILLQQSLEGPERGLFTELVYGVTRVKNTLDWILSKFLKKDLDRFTPQIRNILRLGSYQLIYLDKIPAYAAINQSVELAKFYGHQGVAGLVNAVLRNVHRQKETIIFPSLEKEPVNHIALKYSHPEWLVSRWIGEFGIQATIKLCEYNNRPAALALRVNTLKISREKLLKSLADRGLTATSSNLVPEGIIVSEWPGLENVPEFSDGYFLMQDEGSMLVSHILNPTKDATVIDVCAAPGTKTTHLAQLMQDEGKILAFDIHPHKLKLIEANCKRLGIHSVQVGLGDGRELTKLVQEKVAYILVDAPCSGLGVLGRRADARWRKNPRQLQELPVLQKAILTETARLLAPGGVLVYSTCSIAKEENQEVVAAFLAENRDFYLENLNNYLPFLLTDSREVNFAKMGMIQFLPQVHGIDGFFIARLRKKATAKDV